MLTAHVGDNVCLPSEWEEEEEEWQRSEKRMSSEREGARERERECGSQRGLGQQLPVLKNCKIVRRGTCAAA